MSDMYFMSKLLRVSMFILALYTTACSVDSKISDSRINDFLNTRVVSTGSAFADGQSDLVVELLLLNSDGSPVIDYQITSDMSQAGNGVFATGCSKSNSEGRVRCIYRAVEWGMKTVIFGEMPVDMRQDVEFLEPPGRFGNITGLTSVSTQRKTTSGGYKISFSMDPLVSKPVQTTGAGYKVMLSVQPVLSED